MVNNESRLIFYRSKRVVMQIDTVWHTCARVSGFRIVSKEIIYGASDAGEGGLYREHSNYSAWEKWKFLISRRLDLICHMAAARIRLISRFFAKESEIHRLGRIASHVAVSRTPPKLFWQPFKRALCSELRKNPRTSAVGFSLSATTGAGVLSRV